MLTQAESLPRPGLTSPIHGHQFVRFCYAGSSTEMREAVRLLGQWLGGRG